VSHLSQDRARERVERLRLESILDVVCSALSCGASGYTFSTHPTNLQVLRVLKDSERIDREFDLYPVLPYAQGYVRLANEKGMSGLVREILSKLSLSEKAKAVLTGGASALTLNPSRMLRTYVDMELGSYLRARPARTNVRSVLLHQVVTDLCLGFKESSLLDSFMQHIHDKYSAKPGFVTYNLVRFVDFLREAGLSLRDVVIMTPFNSIGFQMSPSRDSCEACLSTLRDGEVIAMSIMAGGYLSLDQAFDYIRALSRRPGIAVGASTEEHARDTFTRLRTLR